METRIAEYKQQNTKQTLWILATTLSIPFFFLGFILGNIVTVGHLLIYLLVILVYEIFCIINLSKTTKKRDVIGLDMAKELSASCEDQKELKDKLVQAGIPRNFALFYAIRTFNGHIDTKTPNDVKPQIDEAVQTRVVTYTAPTNITCPQCHTEKVRWIPYKKTSFGTTFYIWLILSLLGVTFSPIVTIVMFILYVLIVIVRIVEGTHAKKFNQYQCDMCGNIFQIPKEK